ncbi:MAG: 3-hydroxybutyryl-CoA dehydrogenase [Anaerolineae bacterium]|nr:3-hydroxybutyryl-CoA dehydrogenase [Anaerolineae bacterium]
MDTGAIRHIMVVGAGTMGTGIAQVLAMNGFYVILCDVEHSILEHALDAIMHDIDRRISKGKLTAEDKQTVQKNIIITPELTSAREADFVIESVSETPELKRDIFARLDQLTSPGVILATNTSSISITAIGSATDRPEKVVGMHFMNPVPVMKLIEIIPGLLTSQDTIDTVMVLGRKLGKTPVEAADYPGFIANRVLMPMINEAIYALMEGVGTVEAIDTVMKLGMNHPMGPLALADFIGLDVVLHVLNVLNEGLGDPKYRPCPLLRKMVTAGQLGCKSGQGFYTYDESDL